MDVDHAPTPLASGLTAEEAARRLGAHGRNDIEHAPPASPWVLLAGQFRGAMTWLLLAACVISAALGEVADAVAIGTIMFVNALVGFLQEFRAEKAVQALQAMTAPRATVRRDGQARVVPAAEVVPGDLLLLEGGDLVAADACLVVAHALRTSEAALTGESTPVDKRTDPTPDGTPLAERHDRVFMGTAVAAGTAVAEVCATGMATELGRIARLLGTAQTEETPLARRLAHVGHILMLACVGIVMLVASVGLAQGRPWFEVLMSSVALAVAAVPEGLVAVVTIALALGVQRMVARHALIRRLPAVETLGCASVVCTDKTGTLTTGVMVVRELWGGDHRVLLDAAAACCDAELDATGRGGVGDPTELAILMAAAERGITRGEVEATRPRADVEPFDAATRRMAVARGDGRVYVKGAVEVVLPACEAGAPEGATTAAADMAGRGLRVLAVAVGRGSEARAPREVVLLGLVGIADPPRTEAVDAVAQARRAGIRTVMITGDHPATAHAIARELGILAPGDDAAEVVHARATPERKLDIVRAWKARGAVVAMTGDGVNDAPALREAHIGIAMGRGGTEVTREASDMILTDDNFASIIAAVREGRGIYENIRKTLVYLLTGNAGELMLMLGAVLWGLPLPLLPLHLLWINLVTDGLPALALVMDPPPPDTLEKPPRPVAEPMLGRAEWRRILVFGAIEAGLALLVFRWAISAVGLDEARSLVFAVVVFCEILRAFAARSAELIFWEVGAFSNVKLLGVVAISVMVQLALHHVPWTQALFRLSPLPPLEVAAALGLGLVPVTVIEVAKLVRRVGRR